MAREIIHYEYDLFVDFNLAALVLHFKLDTVATARLALACKTTYLRPKGMHISNGTSVLTIIADSILSKIDGAVIANLSRSRMSLMF